MPELCESPRSEADSVPLYDNVDGTICVSLVVNPVILVVVNVSLGVTAVPVPVALVNDDDE